MQSLRLLTLCLCALLATNTVVWAQTSVPDELRGHEDNTARGIMDGNLIETNYRNHGEWARWNDNPWGNWPRGIGGRHIDGIGMFVGGRVPGERVKWSEFYPDATTDTLLNPIILRYSAFGTKTGPDGRVWGWNPLPGFNNPNRVNPITLALEPVPAISDDTTSWPQFWPDRLDNIDDPGWPSNWNGLFGRGVFNADLESYYVMDDHSDREYLLDPRSGVPNSEFGVFYPNPADSTMGGFGLITQVRSLQWANFLAEDTMFLLYRITNRGATDLTELYFSQLTDYGLGNEEGDELALFNAQLDIAFGFDADGIGTRQNGGVYDLGYAGFAFLESPARAFDGLDNDEDGITDESRFNDGGLLIEGQDAILATAAASYDMVNFERFNGPITERRAYLAGRWWTGDENLDWVGFDDVNANGIFDAGERLNNDVGADGLGVFDLGYPGPDTGEADGIPTSGEPNFGELDVDESDQIGLTGFELGARPFFENGDNLREDFWLWDRIINFMLFPLGIDPPDAQESDVEPWIQFTSGPIELAPQTTDFFSMAWLFGADERDFFKNRVTVQNIYNADYQFAQPPFTPTLQATAGDGRVILSWDTLALASFDRFLQEFDFQGFKLYKGTDNLLSDARVITNSDGTPSFYRPIAQWDKVDGIQGLRTVFDGEAVYNLGDDTGLEFFYIDEDVTNGQTYYYAIVAYDNGFVETDGTAPPIDPQENTFNISVSLTGDVTGVSQNAAVVTPRSNPAGYVGGASNEDLSELTGGDGPNDEGQGTGSARVVLVNEQLINPNKVYRVRFYSEPTDVGLLYETTGYDVVDGSGNQLVGRSPIFDADATTSLIEDAFVIEIANQEAELDLSRTGWVANAGTTNEVISRDPSQLESYTTDLVPTVQPDTSTSFITSPFDYEIRWSSDFVYETPRVGGRAFITRENINFEAIDVNTGEQLAILVEDRNGSREFEYFRDDIIIAREEGRNLFKNLYRVRFSVADTSNFTEPSPGNTLRVSSTRPFATGDYFEFTLRAPSIDLDQAAQDLENIAVVPNPYIAASEFEPRDQVTGRGERRIQFINLPLQCTIRIFNLRGEQVAVLEHEGTGNNGATFWDLKTTGGQDVAYGVYIYHVEAPGIGEYVDKFALVK
ncbi:MAG: hypothetical protein RhofKO_42480 [Rhodothermales bacterium]